MLDALGFARGARGVQQEQRMLRVDPHGVAYRRLALDHVVPPEVAALLHLHVMPGALEHDDLADRLAAAGKRLVGGFLELDHLAATPAAVMSNTAPASSMRSFSESAEKPPNTTE